MQALTGMYSAHGSAGLQQPLQASFTAILIEGLHLSVIRIIYIYPGTEQNGA
jgi:hypothetical protein